ncbi:MAG: hypothetical protein COA42_02080 [Alteromonadaceae bacterium]|nr:MAG: hypothetical protein COA42_02080 [Alteromonadaceae bacterium]
MSKILVVDDADSIRTALSRDLRAYGYQVSTAENGLQALNLLKQEPDFNLLLVDLNMPIMNGLELVEAIRIDPILSPLNVLIMSTESSTAMRDRGRALKIAGWVLKPLHVAGLLSVAETLME